jgi:hypothetical protein
MMKVLLSAIHVKVLVTHTASAAVTIVIVNGVAVDVWMMMKTVMVIMEGMKVITVIADTRDAMQHVAHYHAVVLMSVVDGVEVIIKYPIRYNKINIIKYFSCIERKFDIEMHV